METRVYIILLFCIWACFGDASPCGEPIPDHTNPAIEEDGQSDGNDTDSAPETDGDVGTPATSSSGPPADPNFVCPSWCDDILGGFYNPNECKVPTDGTLQPAKHGSHYTSEYCPAFYVFDCITPGAKFNNDVSCSSDDECGSGCCDGTVCRAPAGLCPGSESCQNGITPYWNQGGLKFIDIAEYPADEIATCY